MTLIQKKGITWAAMGLIAAGVVVGFYFLVQRANQIESTFKSHHHYTGFEEVDQYRGAHFRTFEAKFGPAFRKFVFSPPQTPGRLWSGAFSPDFIAEMEERAYRLDEIGYLLLIDVQSGGIIDLMKVRPGDGDYDLLGE